jgi:hypothetical protein
MAERLASAGDLWANLHQRPASLAEAFAQVRAQLSDEDWQEAHAARVRKPKSRSAPRAERRRGAKR